MKSKILTNASTDKRLLIRKSIIFSWAFISVTNYLTQGWTLMILSITYLLYAAMLQSDLDALISTRGRDLEHTSIEILRWLIFTTLIASLSRNSWAAISIYLAWLALMASQAWAKKQLLTALTSACIPLALLALTMHSYFPKQGLAGLTSIPLLIITLRPVNKTEA